MRLAIDIGGTFTDLVLEKNQTLFSKKVLTSIEKPELAVIDGVLELLDENKVKPSEINMIIHGTTLATNAVIERKGAHCCFITTSGFRDVLDIGYESRFDQYDLLLEKTLSIVPRKYRYVVEERTDVDGKILKPLNAKSLDSLFYKIKKEKFESIGIGFLHSYANPKNEKILKGILSKKFPKIKISISSEVCPEIREYERFTTTVINSYIKPLISIYLENLKKSLISKGFKCSFLLMTSGGSLTNVQNASDYPIRLVESGPAGGVILATSIARELDLKQVISFDMGGTTAKITLIENMSPNKAREFEVDRKSRFQKGSGLPIRIPVIEMVEIGAGGGSIARVNKLDQITIGPDSAGADPGPACYGLGGQEPTITDADLIMGKINPDNFASGKIKLFPNKSESVIRKKISKPLRLDLKMSALGITEMVDETMANAARVHAVEQGQDTENKTLIAFGGAAPLHVSRIAEKLKVRRIIIPTNASVGSAVGFLLAPVGYEVIKSLRFFLKDFNPKKVNDLLNKMNKEAENVINIKKPSKNFNLERFVYMRYFGQGHEIKVKIDNRKFDLKDTNYLKRNFEIEYEKLYGRTLPHAEIEVLTWTISLMNNVKKEKSIKTIKSKPYKGKSKVTKLINISKSKFVNTPTFYRKDLSPGNVIMGSCVIVEDQTTVVVNEKFKTKILSNNYLDIEMIKGK